jgi:hypothetical protein
VTQFLNDEIHDVPHDLYVVQNASDFESPEFDADYTVAGIKWLSAASDEYPYQRMLTKVLKDQIDTSDEPGDNSLQGWWTRSQTDWSGGAGQEYMEPATADLVRRSFFQSAGVDVFNRPGFVSLLPKAVEIARNPGAIGHLAKTSGGYTYSAGNVAWKFDGTNVDQVTLASDIKQITAASDMVLFCLDDEVRVLHPDGSFTTISGFTGVPVLAWVKQRLMLMVGDKAFEIPTGDLSADVDLSAKTPKVDLKDSSWVFTGATGTPTSILMSGYGDAGSSVLALLLDDRGALPDLTAPVEVAQFPVSEKIVGGITSYLGTYIGILTDKGVRVGTVSEGGGLVYGPLIGAPVSTGTSSDISVYDRFMYYPVSDAGDGRGGMVIVDLSTADEDGRNAWANFTRIPGNYAVTDSIVIDARHTVMLAVVPAAGGTSEVVLYEASDSGGLEDKGWLNTSWIRFGTLEKKFFDEVKVVCDPPMAGRVGVFALDDEVKATSLGHLTAEIGQEATFKVNGRRSVTDMALRFELERSTSDPKVGPELAAWNVRAWPSVDSRGETVVLPLLCFDFERDSLGVQVGHEGYAKERWMALTAVLGDGTGVQVTEQHSGFKYTAIAEDATFTQISPPTGASGFGGIAQVVFRTT